MTHDRKIYLIVGGVLVVLLVVTLVRYRTDKSDEVAQQKAQALTVALKAAGLPAPADPQRLVDALGDDGGTICGMTGSDFAQSVAKTNLSVGGGFYQRPVLASQGAVAGVRHRRQHLLPGEAGGRQGVRELPQGRLS